MTQPAEPPVAVELPPDRTAAGVARERTRAALRAWRLPTLLDPLLLVVSELVGNAVRHGRPPVAMLLRRSGSGVRVEVHDDDATAPAAVPGLPDDTAESGRGGFLVEAVSAETGVEQVPGDGKVVWATVQDDGLQDDALPDDGLPDDGLPDDALPDGAVRAPGQDAPARG